MIIRRDKIGPTVQVHANSNSERLDEEYHPSEMDAAIWDVGEHFHRSAIDSQES